VAQRNAMPNHGGATGSPLPQRICLLVLGMHRSGTSAMTRVISLLGADLPRALLGEGPGNEAGHWEPAPLVTHHDWLLEQLASRWDDWRKLDPAVFPPSLREEAGRKFHTLVDEEYGASPLFVLKDPRICRFVPFVAELLQARSIATRHVLMLRNPLAVVASLAARNGMTPGFAALMWLRHVLDAEAATRHAPRAIVSYENLLLDWRAAMRTVSARVGIRWPCPIEVSGPQVEAFLSAELQHHAPSRHELAARVDIAGWVKAAYDALRALERDPDEEAACRTLDRIAAEFDAVAPVFAAAMFPELAARERTIAARLQAQHEHAFAELRQAAAQREAEAAELRATVAAREQDLSSLRAEVVGRDCEVAELRSEAVVRDQQMESLRSGAAMLEAEAVEARAQAETLRGEIAALRADVSIKNQRLAALDQEAGLQITALTAANEKVVQSLDEADNLKRALAEKDAAFCAAEERRDRAESELRWMQASRSWRVTRPLRVLANRGRQASRLMRGAAGPGRRFAVVELLLGRIPLLQLRRDRQRVLASGLFDADWYLKQYADVATAGVDAAEHYLRHGAREGRNPSEFFRSSWYLEQNPDVTRAGVNPLVHYLRYGAKEGRLPGPPGNSVICPPTGSDALSIQQRDLPSSLIRTKRAIVRAFGGPSSELANKRDALRELVHHPIQPPSRPSDRFNPEHMNVSWILPDFLPGAGGHMAIFRTAHFLEKFGHKIELIIQKPTVHSTGKAALETINKHFVPFNGEVSLLSDTRAVAPGDALVATDRFTCYPVRAISGFRRKFYFVLDYETSFYPMGSEALLTENTYSMGFDCLCGGDWLAELMRTRYGLWSMSWPFAYDPDSYFILEDQQRETQSIAFYARYVTPRRAVELGVMALDLLHERGLPFHVDFFGLDIGDIGAKYSYANHGVLSPKELGALYRKSAIGVALSATNHSLVTKEMMACGLPVIDLDLENVRAIFPLDALELVHPTPEGIADGIERLLSDSARRDSLRRSAFNLVSRLSWEHSARMVESAIRERVICAEREADVEALG
jgi:glycosyltransferase involved in cell wall biosynthesis